MLKPYDVEQAAQAESSSVSPVVNPKHPRAPRKPKVKKLFVLDTNVLMHDPTSLFRFDEHDLYLPIATLEELDQHKRGLSDVSRNARQASRFLDEIVSTAVEDIKSGLVIKTKDGQQSKGRLFLQTEAMNGELPATLASGRTDNQILSVVRTLQGREPQRAVVLVSKDINMRIKARALGLAAEDYTNDKVLEDADLLYTGLRRLPKDFWNTHGRDVESWKKEGHTYYRVRGPLVPRLHVNEFVFDESGDKPLYALVKETSGRLAVLETLRDYTHTKNSVWGITARNREQNFALNLLMNPAVDFVTLLGQAGTGKTLLALAAGLTQVLDEKRYSEIIMTMQPWMGALEDNLDVLNASDESGGEWGRAATRDLVRSRIRIKSLNFMRGRTFVNKWLIIDEAQNLTPKQMKTLVTRAGPGTKVVCLGNVAQIDTPYLTEGSSGLTYVVDRMKDWAHAGHITLSRGERSRLADHAADVL